MPSFQATIAMTSPASAGLDPAAALASLQAAIGVLKDAGWSVQTASGSITPDTVSLG